MGDSRDDGDAPYPAGAAQPAGPLSRGIRCHTLPALRNPFARVARPATRPGTNRGPRMEDRCEQEVRTFHAFLRDWLAGAVPRTAETFARFAGAMDGRLEVVSPLGTVTGRDALVDEFEGLHGQLAGDAEAFDIWIENFRCRWAEGDHAVVTYEEWHRRRGEPSARLSSALFRRAEAAPCGVAWLHVHETWLPGLAPPRGERFPDSG